MEERAVAGLIGEFRIGEDLGIALEVTAGDMTQVSAVSAAMKPARIAANRPVLDASAAPIALTVASGAAGWTLSLPSATTAALAPGIYGIDARLEIAGGVEITEQTAFVALSAGALS
jgi:hypothetical protein